MEKKQGSVQRTVGPGNRIFTGGTAFFHDLLMIPSAWMLAYWLRFNLGEIPENYLYSAIEPLGGGY